MTHFSQRLLDRAENFFARRQWVALTFRVLQLKRALGLRYDR